MDDGPVDLDLHRGKDGLIATDLRRQRLYEFQSELPRSQEELERLLTADPAKSWPEVAAKAQYLIQLFAALPEGQEPQRQKLIAQTLNDLVRLCHEEEPPS